MKRVQRFYSHGTISSDNVAIPGPNVKPISQTIKRRPNKPGHPGRRGISPKQVSKILACNAWGRSVATIARMCGVSRGAVDRVLQANTEVDPTNRLG